MKNETHILRLRRRERAPRGLAANWTVSPDGVQSARNAIKNSKTNTRRQTRAAITPNNNSNSSSSSNSNNNNKSNGNNKETQLSRVFLFGALTESDRAAFESILISRREPTIASNDRKKNRQTTWSQIRPRTRNVFISNVCLWERVKKNLSISVFPHTLFDL